MRIKRIEIIGFKSFCDRTILTFERPISGIVGPNGCGKSNIVDAIRWCMGEQSAKHLRGKAMDDVIFAGSDSRGPAGMSEVSLTFEDVGFSHEALELALEADAPVAEAAAAEGEPVAQAEQAAVDEAAPEDERAGEGAQAAGGEPAEPAAAGAGDGEPAEPASVRAGDGEPAEPAGAGAGDGEPAEPAAAGAGAGATAEPAPPSVADEVHEMLADRPPPIDFTQYSEVTITRRLFRDGTSGYFLNRTPCRLRDITDFFLGTGVGTKAYSIIEQGRIGMIVSARAQDRRLIIEEAAGITKFKTKKRAAERKLEHTRQNLLRVSDIVSELEKRLGSLRRQAQKAERYRKYKAEVKDIELWTAAHRFLAYRAEEQVLTASLEQTISELDAARTEFEVKDAAVVAERGELAVEERRLSALQEQIFELENRIKLGESKVDFQRREAGELEERVASAQGEIRSVRDRREQVLGDIDRQREELARLGSELAGGDEALAEREASFAEARDVLAACQRELDGARAELATARADLAGADSRRESLARRREDSARRLERVVEETETAVSRTRELDREHRRVEGKLGELVQMRLDLGARTGDFEARKRELEEAAEASEAEVETLRTEHHRRSSRLQSLREIHEKYEGFARGTRAIMQHAAELSDGRREMIRGLVADVVEAPERLEVAVEAALGDRLGGILVGDHDVGAKAVRYLKEKAAGRSSFVPLSAAAPAVGGGIVVEDRTGGAGAGIEVDAGWVSEPPRHDPPRHDPIAGDGVLGAMVDLVRFDDGFGDVARNLLGECVVVDTLERAIDLHRGGVDKTLVTLDGDILDARGVVTGGSRDAQGASVLAQKREIRELEEITAGLQGDLAEATARLVATRQELQRVSKTLDSLRTETHDGEIAIMSHEKDLARHRGELERLRERTAQLNAEQLEIEERLAEVDREGEQVEAARADASDRLDRFERRQLGLIDSVTEGQVRVEELQRVLTEAKVRVAQLGEKRASAEAATLRLEQTAAELAARADKLEASIHDDGERAGTLCGDADALEAELVGVREDRRGKAEALEEGRNGYERRLSDLQLTEMAARELRNRADALSSSASSLEMKLTSLRTIRDNLEDGIDERYQLSLRLHLTDYHLRPQVGEAEEKRLAELKRLIDRMGADINLTAIEEYADISQRHEFLSAQRVDLDSAVTQLERAIHKINRTSRRLFRETFDAVNAQFQDVFPRLFRGGRARLSLTGDDGDLLEAGVEILAQPPGKKNATVEQLSGGEKALTAVALIFAIFLIKPSPFCLLDEVDAPLDDVNVDRYNELVRQMTDRSQFIIITHNKRTMEIADKLYGVTMQEPGVSRLVSVNLHKLEERAAA